MRKSDRTPTHFAIAEFERISFDVAVEIKSHLVDVDDRIRAEEAKNKPSKVILESYLKEREQMLSAIIPFQFQKPKTEVIVEEEPEGPPRAITLTL